MIEQRDNGGSAFPGTAGQIGCGDESTVMRADGSTVWLKHNHGMSLRDWFAGQALPYTLANVDVSQPWKHSAAMAAYEIADAMLEARKQ